MEAPQVPRVRKRLYIPLLAIVGIITIGLFVFLLARVGPQAQGTQVARVQRQRTPTVSVQIQRSPAASVPDLAHMTDIQIMEAGAKKCASPPANFEPLEATRQEIMYYGLPRRPAGDVNSMMVQHWVDIVRNAKHRDCNLISQPGQRS